MPLSTLNRIGTAVLTSAVLSVSCLSSAFAQSTLVTNVKGYTMTSDRELVQFTALQFTGDTIDRIFTESDSLPEGPDLTIIDGEGKTLLPGLIDSHGHVLNYGFSLLRVDMTGTRSEEEAVQRVAEFARNNPGLQWIQGRGWNQVLWDSNEFPSAEALEAAGVDVPMWFSRVDGHAGWANRAAIELAGIDATTPDPDGGMILRDSEGRPTGTFVDTAMGLITRNIPQPSLEETKMALRLAMERLAAQGLTSVHDAGIGTRNLQAYRELLAEGPLPIRIYAMLSATDPNFAENLAQGYLLSDDGTLSVRSVKISADGALGSRGAYLNEDYSDQPGHRGLLLHSPESLTQLINQSMNAGFQVNVHAIGDGANQIVMDNFEALIQQTRTREQRHRIEHAQILRYEDIMRFSELGVIPSMQSTHATSDMNMAQDRIGEVRIHGAYAWRKLLDTGVIIANGSDFPVESPNPFYGLHAAITRQDHNNQPPGGWFPEERMTHEEALLSFTLDGAYAAHQENMLGTLEPGKKADFILINQDLFEIDPSEIWKTDVAKTWVGGRLVAGEE